VTSANVAAETIVRAMHGVPADVQTAAMTPIGWPQRPFGPVRRRPVAEVVPREGWNGAA
jgi:hypothetical protein